MAKTVHVFEIEVDDRLLNDAAKAVLPGIVKEAARQVRARCGFVSAEAMRMEYVIGGIDHAGQWKEETIDLNEATHESG